MAATEPLAVVAAAEAEVEAEVEAEAEAEAEVELEVLPALADSLDQIPPTRLQSNLFDVDSECSQRQWRRSLRRSLQQAPEREGVECLPEPAQALQ